MTASADVTASAPRIVFVCTANIVRSPIAAALLGMRLRDTEPGVVVESAGVREVGGLIDESALRALDRYGIDLREHQSRHLDTGMMAEAALIVGLEREHVREAVLLDPSIWPRAFTLKEIVRRGEAAGARRDGESVGAWIARVHADRSQRDLLGADWADDVPDPYGGPPGGYEDTAEEIDDLVARLVLLVWPSET